MAQVAETSIANPVQISGTHPVRCGESIGNEEFWRIRSELSLDFCKWDSQVGDICTLFRQPLLITQQTWNFLSETAETVAAELTSAEEELLGKPELFPALGVAGQLQSILKEASQFGATPTAARILRFDFHYTNDEWRISEVNSDVPGGYIEASRFTTMIASLLPKLEPAGDPANCLVQSLVTGAREHNRIALLSAPGFLEDQQITAFLAKQLQLEGIDTFLLHDPEELLWKDGRASVSKGRNQVAIDSIFRFYQGEWLARLKPSAAWSWMFSGGRTPVANPGSAILIESKRIPLICGSLNSCTDNWQRMVPECCDPALDHWQRSDEWVLKGTFANTGDSVHVREFTEERQWAKLCSIAKKRPQEWVVQRRFIPAPVLAAFGLVYPCIGVFTINGKAAGIYGRVSTGLITNYAAMDAAVLIEKETDADET